MSKSSFFSNTGPSNTQNTAIASSVESAAASETAAAASATSAATSASSASANVATNAASAAASEASRQAAVSAKTSAETAETNAETAEAAALVSKNASAVSATASEASKVTSVNSASTATTKASEASTSETNAAASAATATSKASDSETARAASVVAKDASVVAKNESVVAKDASVVAKNAAVAAQAAAETAETNAETAETNSANSATASANSATASANSATASEASKVTSVSSASAASTSETNAATSETNAAASYDLFDDRMLGAKSSAPTVDNDGGTLVQGTLYFDTSSQTMKVYGSSGWVPAGSSVNGTSARFKFVATNNQTTFSGSDANSQTLGYDAGFLDVYLSGLRLVNGTDFTATTGTNIVLASGAATGDILEVVAYGTFVLANFNADKLDGQHGSYYTGYTDSAVSALVDSSPAALNTLNELAAALGNDVNFSTTVTNSIATKAPLASPTFTGTATIPTADINAGTIDGTTVGASTASTGAFTTLSASGVLTTSSSDAGFAATVTNTNGATDANGLLIKAGTAGSEYGLKIASTDGSTMYMQVMANGAFKSTPVAGGHAVFNEGGIDADFRVESDNSTHALFVEGSSGNVGIGSSPVSWSTGMRALELKGYSGTTKQGSIAFDSHSGANGYNLISTDTGNMVFYNGTTNRASAVETMRIASSGKVDFTQNGAAVTAIRMLNNNNVAGTYSDLKWQYSSSDGSYGSGLRFKQVDTSHGGQLEFFTDGPTGTYTQALVIDENQQVKPAKNIVMNSGFGIDFSANGNAGGMTSELLDDYEEGTFTPVIRNSTTSGTIMGISSAVANYTKIGNIVTVVLTFTRNDTQSLSGNLIITGLPFTATGGQQMGGNAWVDNTSGDVLCQVTAFNTSTMLLKSVAVPNDYVKTSALANGRPIYVTRTYRA